MKINPKEIGIIITLCLVGFFLLNLGGIYYSKIQMAANRLQFPQYDIYRAIVAFIFFIIGILLEWRKIIALFTRGVKINYPLLVFALLLVAISVIPYITIINLMPPSPLQGIFCLTFESPYTRSALSMMGGVFVILSLFYEQTNT